MTEQILWGIGTVVSLIIFGSFFLFFYFKAYKNEISEYWVEVLYRLRDRLDKIPRLIELVRRFPEANPEALDELIRMRGKAWPMNEPSKEYIHGLLEISQKIRAIWKLEHVNPALAKDMDYLSLKAEFSEIGDEIEKMLEKYNKRVSHFNRLRNFILLRPFMLAFNYRKMLLFEFEP